jgi:hypothetical protein
MEQGRQDIGQWEVGSWQMNHSVSRVGCPGSKKKGCTKMIQPQNI